MDTSMITSVSTTPTTTASTTGTTAKNAISQDAFLQLLVAQLKNQDPTSASSQDPSQMIQQLTAFSNLQEATQTNTLLQGLQSQNQALFQAQAAGMVGKTVKVDGSGFHLQGGQAGNLGLDLSAAANVTVTITDATGHVVATLPEGQLAAGNQTVSWNGKDASGNPLPDGDYSATVNATGADGKAVPYTSNLTLKVDSVVFNQDGSISLMSNGNAFSLSDVLQVLS